MSKLDSIALEDYEKWKRANAPGKFSLFDYLHGVSSTQAIAGDITVAYLQLFWPDFYVYKGLVFLKEEFAQDKYQQLVEQGYSGADLEYWMNLLTIDGLFNNLTTEQALYVGSAIVVMWEKKLAAEYPAQQFKVECLFEQEEDEVYMVFYQQKSNRQRKPN